MSLIQRRLISAQMHDLLAKRLKIMVINACNTVALSHRIFYGRQAERFAYLVLMLSNIVDALFLISLHNLT